MFSTFSTFDFREANFILRHNDSKNENHLVKWFLLFGGELGISYLIILLCCISDCRRKFYRYKLVAPCQICGIGGLNVFLFLAESFSHKNVNIFVKIVTKKVKNQRNWFWYWHCAYWQIFSQGRNFILFTKYFKIHQAVFSTKINGTIMIPSGS